MGRVVAEVVVPATGEAVVSDGFTAGYVSQFFLIAKRHPCVDREDFGKVNMSRILQVIQYSSLMLDVDP